MSVRFRRCSRLGVLLAVVGLCWSGPAEASTVTYDEIIADLDGSVGARNLVRTRNLDGTLVTQTDDGVVESDNEVSDTFGRNAFSFQSVTWQHVFIPIPPVSTFLFGSLEITAFDAELGMLNWVFVESVFVGALNALNNGDGITTLSTSDNTIIALALADNRLSVEIFPLLDFDGLEVRASKMHVEYESVGVAVPDSGSTGSLALLGFLGIGAVDLRRRRRYAAI